jgi:hypothetical protein
MADLQETHRRSRKNRQRRRLPLRVPNTLLRIRIPDSDTVGSIASRVEKRNPIGMVFADPSFANPCNVRRVASGPDACGWNREPTAKGREQSQECGQSPRHCFEDYHTSGTWVRLVDQDAGNAMAFTISWDGGSLSRVIEVRGRTVQSL